MGNEVRIVIADYQPIYRAGLKYILSGGVFGVVERVTTSRIEVVGEASDGERAIELLRIEKPDIAIMDICMPKMDGFAVASAVQNEKLAVAVIFLTMFKEEYMLDRALELGVMGYVLKENMVEEIINCIKAVAEGKYFICPAMSNLLVRDNDLRNTKERDHAGVEILTATERKVLRHVAEMKTSSQIAHEMSISVKTVQNHRNNIVLKLGLRGNMALLKFAMERKSII